MLINLRRSAIYILLLLLTTICTYGQKKVANPYAAIDKKALEIPDSLTTSAADIAKYINSNFNRDSDKARAAFIWIASNIQYDIENMYAINFYEGKEEKAIKPLKTRKGICENYAALFNDVCNKAGLKSYIIEGFTKQNGFSDYLPHAWNAALIDSNWYLFDATWGSGFVSNGKFIRKISNDFFKVLPSVLIKSHMPFDYMWQFLDYPATVQDFIDGKLIQDKNRKYFNYSDSIAALDSLDYLYRLERSVDRIQKNGIRNSLIFDRLQHLKLEIDNYKQNQTVNLYNGAVADYNEGINLLNEFISYRNKQFKPMRTDAAIQSMVDIADTKLRDAADKLKQIKYTDSNSASLVIQLHKSLNDVSNQVAEQNDWLKLYFSKGKAGRKSMFYTVTWFGVPLN